jgi:hypothetical protein
VIGGRDDAPSGRDGTAGEAAVPEPRVASSGDGSRASDQDGPSPRPSPVPPGLAVPQQRRERAPEGTPDPPPGPPPRPPIVDDPGILGLSRIARSRIGSRLFTWFFVLVFTVIVVQMVVAILDPEW